MHWPKMLDFTMREGELMENVQNRSDAAVAALMALTGIDFERIILREVAASVSARLALWRFWRILEGLAKPGPLAEVADLAALCGISPGHVHRQFQALTGRTVADYIGTTRIERAKAMLKRGVQPINAIAQACGYFQPNSFTRAFLRSTGITPLAFRQSASTRDRPLAAH